MRKKILMVVSVLFGLVFINSGLNKFLDYMPVPQNLPEPVILTFRSFLATGWLFPLIAMVEILGGLLFTIPRYRALGAVMLLPILIGIFLFHSFQAPEGMAMAVVLMAIEVWAIIEDWGKFRHLVN